MKSKFWPIASAFTAIVAAVLTWQVHSRLGDETFQCPDVGECTLGSGLSWLLTGAAVPGAILAVLGAAWSRRLHNRNKLGPFVRSYIPDGEQILEVLGVLGAGLFTYWFVRNGPSIEPALPLDIGRPNTWAIDVQNLSLIHI